jgi:hypothetical protein
MLIPAKKAVANIFKRRRSRSRAPSSRSSGAGRRIAVDIGGVVLLQRRAVGPPIKDDASPTLADQSMSLTNLDSHKAPTCHW